MVVMIKTQPNEKRCGEMVERHEFDLPQCCPVTKNPQPGSFLQISYHPNKNLLEVDSLASYITEYIGGRMDVRSMEGMVQNIAQDCANASGVKTKVTASLILVPRQRMRLQCKAWPVL
jgi:NADPH-dependent 7-cyano-7-deazaguanine reductase QueF